MRELNNLTEEQASLLRDIILPFTNNIGFSPGGDCLALTGEFSTNDFDRLRRLEDHLYEVLFGASSEELAEGE